MSSGTPTASSMGGARTGRRRSSVMIEYYRDNYMKSVDKVGPRYHQVIIPMQYEPRSEKTGNRGFRPGPTQTGLYNRIRWLEA